MQLIHAAYLLNFLKKTSPKIKWFTISQKLGPVTAAENFATPNNSLNFCLRNSTCSLYVPLQSNSFSHFICLLHCFASFDVSHIPGTDSINNALFCSSRQEVNPLNPSRVLPIDCFLLSAAVTMKYISLLLTARHLE